MEWNPETLQTLSQCFLQTLSPNPEPRRRAEAYLSEAADRVNFGLAVLRLIAEPSVDDQIRQAAAVNFKNHLRSRWVQSPQLDSKNNASIPVLTPIPEPEKEQIKTLIVPLMLSSGPRIQSQLSEALAVIGKHDFPKSWPSLLPEIVANLQQAKDYASINGLLGTANSIFKKFRYQYKTNDLLIDLKYCLDGFAAPLLEIFLQTAARIDAASTAATLRPLFESQRLCCRIFYSLNFQDLPEFFEDHMKEWMTEFKKYLTTTYPALEESSADGLTLVDDLRAAVCENISLYMEKNEEEFQGYLENFARAVWTLLVTVSASSSRERLTITAIKFLTTVSTSVHHILFAGADVLPQICLSIVIPNVRLRDEDEELFEMNYVEFIRRDIEGSDLDTRRRIACELLKGIATNYKDQVTAMVGVQINNMLASFTANPSVNWKEKDCAIYLVVSLATKKAGGSSVSTDLVNVESFFGSVIVPELQSQDVNGFPMLKAGSLKFFTMFRNQIPRHVAIALMSDVARFLTAESNVVHSYAASCLEKLLLVKDEGGRPRYSSSDITPFLPMLMTNLFNALKFPESEENPYVMKCIMRVLGVADISGEIAGACITGLTSILNEVCRNPKNPIFNHYLFEAVAGLVRRACEKDPSLISAFEASLFPIIQAILVNDVTEFWPYAFQLLAQLLELSRPPIHQNYMQVFEILLSQDSWKRSGNVPALVRLLQAYLKKAPHELNREGRLSQVLGIFNKLVSVSSTDELGFYVLNTVIENLGYDVISPYVNSIWNVLFTRLQNHQTVKFIKSLVVFMSLFLVKHGSTTLVDSINAIQSDLFGSILDRFWIPYLKMITGRIELKLTSLASTRLLCESPVLLNASATLRWGKLLDSIVTLISRPEQDRIDEEPEMPKMAHKTPTLWLLLIHVLVIAIKIRAIVPAIIVFGDSSVDSGNNNQISTILKSNFAPYGRDFDGHKATGRFSNGRIPTDFISEAFGCKPTVPAYLDPMSSIKDFATGVCFASAGTGYDNATSDVLSVIPLWKELEYYKDYQRKLKIYLGVAKASETLREALYLMSLGTNDFLEDYYLINGGRSSQFTVENYENFLIGIARNFITELYGLGARKIVLGGLPPMGCLPLERTINIFHGGVCNEEYNKVARDFNGKLQVMVVKLNKELIGIKLVFASPYDILLDIIQNPSKYGFEEAAVACCASGRFEMSYLCNRIIPLTCMDANKYVFWDSFHPTEKTNRIMADHAVKTSLAEFL